MYQQLITYSPKAGPIIPCDAELPQTTLLQALELSAPERCAVFQAAEQCVFREISSQFPTMPAPIEMLYGPDEPLSTFLQCSMEYLITDFGYHGASLLVDHLHQHISQQVGRSVALSAAAEQAINTLPTGIMDAPLSWFAILNGLSLPACRTIAGLLDANASLLDRYLAYRLAQSLSTEITLMSQAGSARDLFGNALRSLGEGRVDQRDVEIFLLRNGVCAAPQTLQEVGDFLNLTRQRVQQLENRTRDLFQLEMSPFMRLLHISVLATLAQSQGCQDIDTFESQMHECWPALHMHSFSSIAAKFPEIVRHPDKSIIAFARLACADCPKAQKLCRDIARAEEPFPFASFLRTCACESCTRSFITPDAASIARLYDMAAIDDALTSRSNPLAKAQSSGSIRSRLYAMLYDTPHALSTQEIADAIAFQLNRPVSKNIIGSHMNSFDDIVLWGKGTYIHERHIPYPADILRSISTHIKDHFVRREIPLVNVTGIYHAFAHQLSTQGVPGGHALYSLLRKMGDPDLELKEYPWICDRGKICGRTTFAKYFYNVLRLNNGFITNAHAKELANSAMVQPWALDGLSEYSPFLINANDGWYNIDSRFFDFEGISKIVIEVAQNMSENDIISARKVFEDYKEQCCRCGAKSYDMLYRVIELLQEDLPLSASRIPHLIKTNRRSLSVREAVRCYIRHSPTPVSQTDIIEEFGHKRGINTSGLCITTIKGDDIILVGIETYWTTTKAGLAGDTLKQLEDFIAQRMEHAPQLAGFFYQRSVLFPTFDGFPQLKSVQWNDELLKYALRTSGRFGLYGENQTCIVDERAFPRVSDEESFYRAILENEFHGQASFSAFKDYCIAHQIVSDLKPEFFDTFESIHASRTAIHVAGQ